MIKKLSLVFIVFITIFSSCKEKIPVVNDITVTDPITSSTTWDSTKVYIIEGTVYVKENQVLTIKPGTVIKFKEGAEFDVGNGDFGTIKAIGTAKDPIIFTSAATVKKAGDWDGIWLYDGANNCEFEYCTFEYGGGYSEDQGVMNLRQTNASFKHCTFNHSAGYGIEARGCGFDAFENNTITNCANNEIKIDANQVHTIGTNNVFDGKGITVKGVSIDKAGTYTWLNQTVPYIVTSDFNVGATGGATLEISAGTTVKFAAGVEVDCGVSDNNYGTIKALGTKDLPIIFTSSAISPSAGDWDGFWLYENSVNCAFEFCTFNYGGGYSDEQGVMNLRQAGASFKNCTFSNSGGYGIEVSNAGFDAFENNTINSCLNYEIKIDANYAHTIGTGNTYDGKAIYIKGVNIENDGNYTWKKQSVPYFIYSDFSVGSAGGATLTIEAGTTLEFGTDAEINFGYSANHFGALVAQGTSSNPITFTSASPSPSNGDWDGLWFYENTMNTTVLDNCIISYGGSSDYSGNISLKSGATTKISVSNSTLSYSKGYGVYKSSASDANPTLTNITYTGNTKGDTNF